MRIENRRDMSLAMSRNVRRAKNKTRANVKTCPASKLAAGDSKNSGLLSRAAGSRTNSVSAMLKKNNYTAANNAAKEFQKEAERQLAGKKEQTAGSQEIEKGIELYNTMIKSMNRAGSGNMSKYVQEMKTYLDKNEEDFSGMGIQIKADGTMQADKKLSADADLSRWYEFLEKASVVSLKTQAEAQSGMYGMGMEQIIYGTSYNKYGKESF